MPRNKKYVYICSPKRKVFRPGDWRDAGVVDRAALEMRCTGNCTGGSNPSLSAVSIDYQSITEKAHSFTHTNVKTVRFLIGYFANNQLKSANPIVIIPSF